MDGCLRILGKRSDCALRDRHFTVGACVAASSLSSGSPTNNCSQRSLLGLMGNSLRRLLMTSLFLVCLVPHICWSRCGILVSCSAVHDTRLYSSSSGHGGRRTIDCSGDCSGRLYDSSEGAGDVVRRLLGDDVGDDIEVEQVDGSGSELWVQDWTQVEEEVGSGPFSSLSAQNTDRDEASRAIIPWESMFESRLRDLPRKERKKKVALGVVATIGALVLSMGAVGLVRAAWKDREFVDKSSR